VTDRSAELDGLLARTEGNGHLAGSVEMAREAVQAAAADLQERINELEEMGVELKGIEEGLVDFQSMRDGRVVYLCWRLGEETISYWHELDTGFPGLPRRWCRRPRTARGLRATRRWTLWRVYRLQT
jgi:hypothetical protein